MRKNPSKVKRELAFSLAEFKQRIARVRKQMSALDLDVLVVSTPENIYCDKAPSTFNATLHPPERTAPSVRRPWTRGGRRSAAA